MKFLYVILCMLIPTISYAQDYSVIPNVSNGININECPQFFPELPFDIEDQTTSENKRDLVTICRLNYAVIYDTDCKIPLLTFENLRADEIDGKEPRKDKFKPDPDLFPEHSATLKDYAKSGYDRGHMVPANDMREDSAAMEQTFYLSNMIPQVPNANRGNWKRLESLVHDLINQNPNTDTFIITGAVPGDKKLNDAVCIPDGMFKIIITKDAIHAYIMPNRKMKSMPLDNWKRTVEEISEYSLFNFISL